MNYFHSIILGIVEGITEFLPISSTAHMDIARYLLGVTTSDFTKSFEIIIQLGAIWAVVVIYFHKVISSYKYMKNLIIAFIPTGIIGFILYKIIKTYLLGNIWIEALALILITLGLAQALAVIPGVSRSGAVIISGRAIGLDKKLITEFSFLLAVPTMFVAALYDIYKNGLSFTHSDWIMTLIGFIVSFSVALIIIEWFLSYIRKHSFKIFGWYRIVLGAILILAILLKFL